MMIADWNLVPLVLYLAATLLYLLRFILGQNIMAKIGLRLSILAALGHAALIFWKLFQGQFTWSNYGDAFSLSAWLVVVIFLFLCLKKRFFSAGLMFLAVTDLLYILSLIAEAGAKSLAQSTSLYLTIHLMSLFLAMVVFSIGLVSAVLFLISEKQLKSRKFSRIKWPPLTVLDEVHYKAMLVGFFFFTLTVLTGAGYSKMMTGYYLQDDLKQVLSLILWFFFAILLNFRVQKGWQGHKGILVSFVGFVGLALLFVVGLSW